MRTGNPDEQRGDAPRVREQEREDGGRLCVETHLLKLEISDVGHSQEVVTLRMFLERGLEMENLWVADVREVSLVTQL